MKSIFNIVFILSVATLATSFSDDRVGQTFSLTVQVTALRSSQGTLQFALYNRAGSIPDQHYKNYYKLLKTEIRSGSGQIVFLDVPEGRYAVNIFHDDSVL